MGNPLSSGGPRSRLKAAENDFHVIQTIINHALNIITIFIGGMLTIPSHGWCMALF